MKSLYASVLLHAANRSSSRQQQQIARAAQGRVCRRPIAWRRGVLGECSGEAGVPSLAKAQAWLLYVNAASYSVLCALHARSRTSSSQSLYHPSYCGIRSLHHLLPLPCPRCCTYLTRSTTASRQPTASKQLPHRDARPQQPAAQHKASRYIRELAGLRVAPPSRRNTALYTECD